ncbi:MAG: PepSY domain-containing protein [Oscillospiraceae bacterium]
MRTINEPTELGADVPEAVEPTMTAVPTATQKPSESAKPAAAAKPSAKPTESTKPTASAKPERRARHPRKVQNRKQVQSLRNLQNPRRALRRQRRHRSRPHPQRLNHEPETAVDAALKHAKVSEKDADVYKARIEELRGTSVYIIGFTAGDADYEYEINALTGKVEGWERLRSGAAEDTVEAASASENSVTSSAAGSNLPELIDVQAAKLTAYSHAGIAEKDAQSVKSALRLDGLKLVYEIQFSADKYAYDYT